MNKSHSRDEFWSVEKSYVCMYNWDRKLEK